MNWMRDDVGCSVLDSDDVKLVWNLVGCLVAVSCDAEMSAEIRLVGGIPLLLSMLQSVALRRRGQLVTNNLLNNNDGLTRCFKVVVHVLHGCCMRSSAWQLKGALACANYAQKCGPLTDGTDTRTKEPAHTRPPSVPFFSNVRAVVAPGVTPTGGHRSPTGGLR